MILKSFFFVFLFSNISSLASASLSCKNLFQNEIKVGSPVSAEFIEFKNEILNLQDISIFWGRQKPKWEQYNQLTNLLKKATQINSENRNQQFTEAQILVLKSELQTWALDLHQKALEIEPTKEFISLIDSNYGYFKLYERINKEVGLNIFPLRFLDLVTPTKDLIKDAEKTVGSNEKALSELFKTTGHKSKSEYIEYVKAHSEKAKKLLSLTENDLVVAIHRPENARFWVPISGFQNQRTTGSSNGSMNPNYRNQVESNLTFQNTQKYSEKSVRYMPNYGEARPRNGYKTFSANKGAENYGSDLWIVKKEIYDTRATWTPRDSFGQKRVSQRELATLWDQMFIPWKDRELMVPYALNSQQSYYYDSVPKSKVKPFSPSSIPKSFKMAGERYGSSYFEVQIWGPLTLDDIQAFHFKENPPNKELYELLISKNIEVWDERSLPAKKYKGDESK